MGLLQNIVTRMSGARGTAKEDIADKKPRTRGYKSAATMYQQRPRDLPPLGWDMVRAMILDPAVRLGLAMRAAPIYGVNIAYKVEGADGKTKWKPGVLAKRPEVGEFVRRQLARIWSHGLDDVLTAQVWGWSAGEVLFRSTSRGTVEVDSLLARHSADTRALIRDGEIVGTRVLRVPKAENGHVDLGFPKSWFHAHRPEPGDFYGTTALLGCYSPWADKCFQGGATDVRRLFMHKDAYGGADLSYPDAVTWVNGVETPNRDLALQIVEQIQAGGVTVRPAVYDEKGNELWTMKRATVPSNPQHILEYPKDLDTEIYHGLEIPDDVIETGSTGSWDGKSIPMMAFYSGLDCWVISIINDLVTQILDPLVLLNFGTEEEYAVTHQPLADQAMERLEQAKQPEQPQAQPQQPGQPSQPRQQIPPRPPQPGQPPAQDDPTGQYRLALDAEEAVGQGVLNAAELVRAAKTVIRMSQARAPKGGVTIDGEFFEGGKFIPGKTQEEVDAAAAGQSAGAEPAKKPKLSKEEKAAEADRKFEELMQTKTPKDAEAFRKARSEGIMIPPAWTDVAYYGADQDIRAEGRDDKGRKQRAENPAYRQRISDENNARISAELTPRMPHLRNQLRQDAAEGSEESKVLYLISVTGFRIGGKGDGKAKEQAYGASTLMGEHVRVEGDTVHFDFPGKKGVRQEHSITDPLIARMVADAEPGKPVFTTRDTKVRAAWQERYGGTKVHDIRHVVATEISTREIEKVVPPPPKNERQRKSIIKRIAEIAAHTLGNNPSQTLGTYIDPQIWSRVEVAA